MKRYTVVVIRSFAVTLDAESPSAASQAAEAFLGYHNAATQAEQMENHFKIQSIDMLENDVVEIESIN
ncbi:MAG: hypothetical protein WCE68_12615 [Anaerolineales bacterium]